MNTKNRKAGRPESLNEGRPVNVYLDFDSLELATKIGCGNVSRGIRLALQRKKSAKVNYNDIN